MANKRKRPVSLSEGAMIQREYVNKFLERVTPTQKDFKEFVDFDSITSFRNGVDWLKAKLFKFLATEVKRTAKPGGLGRRTK